MKTKEWLKKHWLELWLVYGFSALIPGWLGDTDLMLAIVLPFGTVMLIYNIISLKRLIAIKKGETNER